MATKQYLDKAGLKEVLLKLKEKFAEVDAVVFRGAVENVAALPALSGATTKAGDMYTVNNEDVTTADFVEGAGKAIDAFSEVVVVNTGTEAAPVYKWYVMGNVFTLKDKTSFGDAFPAAPFDEQAFLYTGPSTYDYVAVASPAATDDPSAFGWYESDGAGNYTLSTDTAPAAGKTYYTREDQYIKGGIYQYDGTNDEWVSLAGNDVMNRITEAEIDDLFDELWPND